tara:strand:+ start:506 stop:1462 length:957 start_codon:yes stop_codon:yes gene_type:complete
MISRIIFLIIKFFTSFLKKFNLDRLIFDKIFFYIGLNQISENRKIYNDVKNIQEVDLKIFSQNGEDGIIDYLMSKLKLIPSSTNFIEIGVGDYRESNTRFIYNRFHPKGLIVDCMDNMESKVKPHINLWKGDLRVCNTRVNSKNINEIIKNNCDFQIDLFSIDIDSVDYWIIKELKKNISKIFIAEFNPVFGPDLRVTVPNIDSFDRTKYHYSNLCYGMSLRALIELMDEKNYYFIGTNLQKMNAFFISKDFEKENFFKNIIINEYKNYTNSNVRDSRDKNYNLNFLSGSNKIKEISDCEVINLESNNHDLVKLKDLL